MRKSSYVLKRTKADYIILLARPYVRKCKVAEVQGASKPSGKKLPACGSKSNVEKKKKKTQNSLMLLFSCSHSLLPFAAGSHQRFFRPT